MNTLNELGAQGKSLKFIEIFLKDAVFRLETYGIPQDVQVGDILALEVVKVDENSIQINFKRIPKNDSRTDEKQ